MVKKVVLSGLAGAVVSFFAGWLLFGLLLANVMEDLAEASNSCMLAEPKMIFIALANLTIGLFAALLFYKIKIDTVKAGIMAGVWISFFIGLIVDFWMAASFDFIQMKTILIDVAGNIVIGALAGSVIAWIQGKLS